MLLKSIVRRTLKIKRHRVQKVVEVADRIEVHLECRGRWRLRCGRCGTRARVRDRLAVRRQEAARLKKEHPELLKRTRYLWLKNPENLTDKQKARLGYLERLNLRTHRAYLLKESFRELWQYSRRGWAERFLNKWFWWATHSRLKPMRDFAWLLRNHQDGVLNYFTMPITNGVVEGLNNKAKAISHRCYGFRTAATFILALYHGLGRLSEPQTVHRFL